MSDEPRIMTASGEFFYFLRPQDYTYKVGPLAKAASKLCRWNGNCNEFYSVLQHMVMVSYMVPPEHAKAALVHDLCEPLTGDCVSPLKALLPALKDIEIEAERAMCQQMSIPFPFHPCIKEADIKAMIEEKRDLFDAGTWDIDFNKEAFTAFIWPLPPKQAYELFMKRWREVNE